MKTARWNSQRGSFAIAFQFVMFAAFCMLQGCGRSGDGVAGEGSSAFPEVAVGNEAYAALRAENEALRRENQMLRRELISKNGALPDSVLPDKGVDSPPPAETSVEDTGYWLATGSKVRHNKRCRNYRKVKGRPCGPNEGRPCKTCGG